MATKRKSLQQQANEILKMAEQHGVESNYFFLTTFKRYQVQLRILADLERAIEGCGVLVEKSYIKGQSNLYSHPAIGDYNRTSDSANRTVATLTKIILTLRETDGDEPDDELIQFLKR